MSKMKPTDPALVPISGTDTGMKFASALALSGMKDVQQTAPQAGQLLAYDGKNWVNSDALQKQIDALVSGIEHEAAVLDIIDTPPTKPNEGDLYIVGTAPTGDFVGHENAIAFFENAKWVFSAPRQNEAHLRESDNSIMHWNGTKWIKVSNASENQKTISVEYSKASSNLDLPLPTGAWKTVIYDGFLDINDNSSHVQMTFLTKDGIEALSSNQVAQAVHNLWYDASMAQRTSKTTDVAQNTRFSLTWLATGAAGQDDRINVYNMSMATIRIKLARTERGQFRLSTELHYIGTGSANKFYLCRTELLFSNVATQIAAATNLRLVCNDTRAKLGCQIIRTSGV